MARDDARERPLQEHQRRGHRDPAPPEKLDHPRNVHGASRTTNRPPCLEKRERIRYLCGLAGTTMRYLVTGGAGFIGCNYVNRLLSRGDGVSLYDNLSRPGIRANVAWLQEQHGKSAFRLVVGDVTDSAALAAAADDADVIVHLAGQTAVTLAVENPRGDFESNAVGTLNVLEA